MTSPESHSNDETLPGAESLAPIPSPVQASRVDRDRLMFDAGFAAAKARIVPEEARAASAARQPATVEPTRVAKREAPLRRETRGDWANGFWTAAAFVATSVAAVYLALTVFRPPAHDFVNAPVRPARLPGIEPRDPSEVWSFPSGQAWLNSRRLETPSVPTAPTNDRQAAAERRRELERSLDIERDSGGVAVWIESAAADEPGDHKDQVERDEANPAVPPSP